MDALSLFCKNDRSDVLNPGPGIGGGANWKDSRGCAVFEELSIKKALVPAVVNGCLLHLLPSLN